jgi:hypothetical protein
LVGPLLGLPVIDQIDAILTPQGRAATSTEPAIASLLLAEGAMN